jgi:FAD/FMN-containing dehydrogenase
MASLTDHLAAIVGAEHVSVDPDVLATRATDWTGRYRGTASALVRPGSANEVAAVLRTCRDSGICVTVQGGRTSLVAGTYEETVDRESAYEKLVAAAPVGAQSAPTAAVPAASGSVAGTVMAVQVGRSDTDYPASS